ncbi:MAG TPA: gamma-glutamylcyclotransferase family protein [Candidatus Binatia bacterium]|nr:gamma-glutamylcyclotransferase family protein [Candidatus Binatia bacterium]
MNSLMDHETHLFVYGTLRKPMHDPLHRLLETEGKLVTTGTFQGKLYDLGRYPGAVPSRGKNDRTLGEIYRLREPQRVFKILDAYEGRRFKRQQVTILQEEKKTITAWIYLYVGSVKGHPLIPSGDYVQHRNAL